ncbi:hypothetical protein ACFQ88_30425 [Paenibacillus sp. NPDC056579]|uniref:hypothetical protein n=1 Tax=unclassified Paenibacillus TaxID=185978 RepID=UPI001EF84A9F|nr:hypothetical protein [Paenibacillus sp. H1-7]ULL15359.1 hypothetical protein DVH26_13475 [Paenibacillus sp. H1-7]
MGRNVLFDETQFTLQLQGWTRIFAFKSKVVVPYRTVHSVLVDSYHAPLWMLRMPGTSLAPLHIYEGSFKYRNEWYFLSYEQPDSLIIVELNGHDTYRYVIFQIDHPREVAAELRQRVRMSQGT